jgi:lipoate-protein ligase B
VWGLEESVIRMLADLGIVAGRDAQHHGVWAGAAKIAAVGVAISRGVTMHGIALNLQPDLGHFGLIHPCGILDRGVTSVAALLGRPLALTVGAATFAQAFGSVFGRRMVSDPAAIEGVPLSKPASVS